MNRITVIDTKRVVSFVCTDELVPRLIASCCSNPASLEGLLLATEAFQRGITRAVFSGLIAFDRVVARQGTDSLYQLVDGSEDFNTISGVFEAIQPSLLEYAKQGDATHPTLIIDLTTRTLSSSAGTKVPRSGTIFVHDGEGDTDRAVTYDLPSAWFVTELLGRPGADT